MPVETNASQYFFYLTDFLTGDITVFNLDDKPNGASVEMASNSTFVFTCYRYPHQVFCFTFLTPMVLLAYAHNACKEE